MADDFAPIRLPLDRGDPLERDVAELEAAVALVERGIARRVLLVGLRRPAGCAGVGAAMAQAAGLAFEMAPDPGSGSLVAQVGPRLKPRSVSLTDRS